MTPAIPKPEVSEITIQNPWRVSLRFVWALPDSIRFSVKESMR